MGIVFPAKSGITHGRLQLFSRTSSVGGAPPPVGTKKEGILGPKIPLAVTYQVAPD